MLESNKKNYPFVSIIVVVLNMANMIGACLSSLMSLDYPKDKYEIIVIDGGILTAQGKFARTLAFNVSLRKEEGGA